MDPYQYLRYLLTELPKGQHQHIEDLLPFNLTPESIKVLS
ncbi:MAG: transposase domain-containing protein [Gammaproteobacteria bacterium]|nr:transposase domain-containing protein [Gammaproteobacteria bacterium]